ncbi:MAG: 13E12 repeat family protein [Actinomycetota bacterium]|nr:13E12 repeat family protein [Actinomycetota bacterium]
MSLSRALAGLSAAVDALAEVELDGETDRGVLDATVELQRLGDRLASVQLRVLDEVDRRDAYTLDAAVTSASWLRHRTRIDHGQASRLTRAAARLRQLPGLGAALAAGDISLAHLTAVTQAAVPRRMAAITEVEDTLVGLARSAAPRDVAVAVRHIADITDPDGTDEPPELADNGPDEGRHLDVWPTIDGLWQIRGLLDTLAGEALATALNALDLPDPAGTPAGQRRSPGQRRADALEALARRVLDAAATPTVGGSKPHLLCVVDIATLVGDDGQAARSPRLRHTGAVSGETARRLAREAKISAVLTLGPWRVVNVGRAFRTLPSWLRAALGLSHLAVVVARRVGDGPPPLPRPRLRPARHLGAGAPRDRLGARRRHRPQRTVPLCKAHHDLVTSGSWRLAYDPDTAICTWTGPAGQTIHTHPDPLLEPSAAA